MEKNTCLIILFIIVCFCATPIHAKTNSFKKTHSKILTGEALKACLQNNFNRRIKLTSVSEIDGNAVATFRDKLKKTELKVKIGENIPNSSAKVAAIDTGKNTVTIEEKKQRFVVPLRVYQAELPPSDLKEFDLVKLNFEQTDIRSVLLFLSELTGENLIIDNIVRGDVTVISPSRITQNEAIKIIYSVLKMNGFTIVRNGKTAEVIRSGEAIYYPITTSTKPVKENEVNDLIRAQMIFPKYIPAYKIEEFIDKMLTKGAGRVIVDNYGNNLIIIDTGTNIKRLMKIIEIIDRPKKENKNDNKSNERKLFSFKLGTEKASDLAQILTALYPSSMNMAISQESDVLFIDTTAHYHKLIVRIIEDMDVQKNEK